MKNRISVLCTLSLTLVFFSFMATAQSNNDGILSKVENPENYNSFQLVSMDKDLSTFANLIVLSGLDTSMKLTDAITLFVPTNSAFDDMTQERFSELTDPKNKSELKKFVQHHIMSTERMESAFEDNQIITTSAEDEITVSKDIYDNVFIGGSRIIKANIEASNGVLHIVNGVTDPNVSLIGID